MCRQFHELRWKCQGLGKVALTDGPVYIRKRACKRRARGAGGRTIAIMCRQFHKLRWEGPKACKVALTYRPVHTRKRACKGRARGAGNVGQACCGQACRIRENAVTSPEWGESRRGSGERASRVSMRCDKGTLDGGSPALIAGGLAAGASRARLLWPPC